MIDFLQAVAKHAFSELGPEELRRLNVCRGCPQKEKRNYPFIKNAKMLDISGYVCTECSCPLATKIFAKEPENICDKWKQ